MSGGGLFGSVVMFLRYFAGTNTVSLYSGDLKPGSKASALVKVAIPKKPATVVQ